MKRSITFFLYLTLLASLSFAQGVRVGDTPGLIWSTQTVGGVPNVLVTVPIAQVNLCAKPANAVPCTNKVTTYTDSTLAVACSLGTQIVLAGTSTCVASPDSQGNWGAWLSPTGGGGPSGNQYEYTVTVNSRSYGPYPYTAGGASGGGGGGSGNATQIQGKDVDVPVTTGCLLQYNGTKFTCALGAASNMDSTIEKTANKDIPGGYLGIDLSGNSNVAHDLTVGNTLNVAGPWLLTTFAPGSPVGAAPSGKTVAAVDSDGFLGASTYPGPFGKVTFSPGAADVTGSTASIGATNLYATAPAGFYNVKLVLNSTTTCSTVGPGGVVASILYTDSAGTVTKATSLMAFTTSGHASANFDVPLFSAGSNNIQYSTTYTACTTGTGTYDIHLTLMRLRN